MRRRALVTIVTLLVTAAVGVSWLLLTSQREGPPGSGAAAEVTSNRPATVEPARARRPNDAPSVLPRALPGTPPVAAERSPLLDSMPTLGEGAAELVVVSHLDGHPVVGAEVQSFLNTGSDALDRLRWARGVNGVTGADGKVTLAVRPGLWTFQARSPGLAPGAASVQVAIGATARLTLRLMPPQVLFGEVREARSHQPITGADVALCPFNVPGGDEEVRQDTQGPPEECQHATSDHLGKVQFSVGLGAFVASGVAPGFRRGVQDVSVPEDQLFQLNLDGVAFIEGWVLEADGGPAGGAAITAMGGQEPSTATASPAGAFSVDVEAGRYLVFAAKAGRAGRSEGLLVKEGVTLRDVRLVLRAGVRLSGRVLDDGHPVSGATVSVRAESQRGALATTTSDPAGRYAFEGLAPGTYELEVSTPEDVTPLTRALLLDGDAVLDITLDGWASLSGRVTTGGKANGGDELQVSVTAGTTMLTAVADSAGRYDFPKVPAGEVLVQASLGDAWVERTSWLTRGATSTLDLDLGGGHELVGRVTKQGLPVDGHVEAQTGDGRHVEALANHGRFSMSLGPGGWCLRAQDESSWSPTTCLTVDAKPLAEVTLALEAPRALEVRVVDGDGLPVEDATVTVFGNDVELTVANSDASGRAQAEVPVEVQLPVDVEVTALGLRAVASVSDLSHELVVRLELPGSLAVDVRGAVPSTQLAVSIVPLGPAGAERRFATSGVAFTVDSVEPGPVRVTVQAGDGRAASAPVTARSRERVAVTVTLAPAGAVSLRVLDASSGRPVNEPQVLVDGVSAALGFEGDRLLVRNLTEGPHVLRVAAEHHVPVTRAVTVQGGATVPLGDVTLSFAP